MLLDLRPAGVLAVTANEGHEVEVLGLLGVGKRIGVDDLAVEASARQD
jgi:hypothetical protein